MGEIFFRASATCCFLPVCVAYESDLLSQEREHRDCQTGHSLAHTDSDGQVWGGSKDGHEPRGDGISPLESIVWFLKVSPEVSLEVSPNRSLDKSQADPAEALAR